MLIMMRKKTRRLDKRGKCSLVKAMKKALCSGVRILHSPIQHLNANISYETTENAQLKGTGVAPQVQPPPGCIPILLHGFHMHHLIWWSNLDSDIGFKPQAIMPASTCRKKVKKKKSEVKTKKVASVSFLGVLFFMLLFGGLVPLLKVDMEAWGNHLWVEILVSWSFGNNKEEFWLLKGLWMGLVIHGNTVE